MRRILPLILLITGCSHFAQEPEVAVEVFREQPQKISRKHVPFENKEYLPGRESVIGMVRYYQVRDGDSLMEIARSFDLGFNEIIDANPEADPFVPMTGTRVEVPTEWILPDLERLEGIVINTSERRLYFFPDKSSPVVYTYPIGIGDDGTETPIGTYKIIQKKENPDWSVPLSIRKEDPNLPGVVPPGPDNPLGSHALRLSVPSLLIHGTNRPWGIGRKVSHGCIQLYPEDIPRLYEQVKTGTLVTIVKQPVKVGKRGDRIYLEVHSDDNNIDYKRKAIALLRNKNLLNKVDPDRLMKTIEDKTGVPMIISIQ